MDLGRIHRRAHDCGALPGASQTQFSVDTRNAIEVVLTSGQKIEFDHGVSLTVQRPNKLRSDRKGDLVRGTFYYDGKALSRFDSCQTHTIT